MTTLAASPVRRLVMPRLASRRQVARAALLLVSALSLSLLLQLFLVSPLQQRAAQQKAFDSIRGQLAAGTAPVTSAELAGKKGAAIGYLEVPDIGVRQAIVEGTDAGDLLTGPGHRRDTPLPGQVGTSVVMGRRAAYGGPFARIADLKVGATVRATMGAGVFDYRVVGVRRSGDPAPAALRRGSGRIVLVTADGPAFMPSGLVLVDADLIVPAVSGAAPLLTAETLPNAEKLMSVDTDTLWRLVLWMQVLIAVALGTVWAIWRWSARKAWVTFLPAVLLVGLFTAGEAVRLLPNLL